MRLDYQLLDVFTDRQFGGNQLAVFLDPPPQLPSATMQRIARELNLSEVTFLFPPADSANDYRLRIFTPLAELPFAGHPSVGSAFALAQAGRLQLDRDGGTVVFEEGVGPIALTIETDAAGKPSQVWMRQPKPQFLDIRQDRREIAEMLSLAESDLAPAPLQALSSGLPFLFVPLVSLAAVERAHLQLDAWQKLVAGSPAQNVFITTSETIYATSSAHSRMFAPALGLGEDPATGSASGPLGVYLLKYGMAQGDEMWVEQGFEMGRASMIGIRIERDANGISGVAVGGSCVRMGFGALLLD